MDFCVSGRFFVLGFKFPLDVGKKGQKKAKVWIKLPLTESLNFRTKLQRRNRIVVPRKLRWRCKMEAGELLEVYVGVNESEGLRYFMDERFFAKMGKDGRLFIPKLTMEVMEKKTRADLVGRILDVTISPTRKPKEAASSSRTESKPADRIADLLKKLGSARKDI